MLMKEYLRMAIDSIRSNKMRALLTMLGIIIGIASVITIIAAGDGVRAYMNSQLEAVGTNTVIISVDTEEGSENDLITNEDIEALLENEMVRAATPQLTGYGTGQLPQIHHHGLHLLRYRRHGNRQWRQHGERQLLYGK